MRPRRSVPGWLLTLLRPCLRYSESREAYVLRLVGRRAGPVLRRSGSGPFPPPVEPLEHEPRFTREPADAPSRARSLR